MIIGALCCVWGIVMFLCIPDSPLTARGFSDVQKRAVVRRVGADQTGMENRHFKWYQVLEALTDYKLYFHFGIALMQSIVNGGVSNFGTVIIKGFGFSTCMPSLHSFIQYLVRVAD